MKPLFFSESAEKGHMPPFPVEPVVFTWPVNVNIKERRFSRIEKLGQMTYRDLLSEALTGRRIIFGYDLDEQGQLMASVLYYQLVFDGVDKSQMARMPLTENGVAYVGSFYDAEQMKEALSYRILERVFMARLLKNGVKAMGLRKAAALSILTSTVERGDRVQNLNPEGTSTVTYITKCLLGEQ